MRSGKIINGPGLFDLGLALLTPRGRSIEFSFMDAEDQPQNSRCYINSIDNGIGDGRFIIQGFHCGSDGRYKATYNPITGKGDLEY